MRETDAALDWLDASAELGRTRANSSGFSISRSCAALVSAQFVAAATNHTERLFVFVRARMRRHARLGSLFRATRYLKSAVERRSRLSRSLAGWLAVVRRISRCVAFCRVHLASGMQNRPTIAALFASSIAVEDYAR